MIYEAREREHVWACIGSQGHSPWGSSTALYFTFFKEALDKVQK